MVRNVYFYGDLADKYGSCIRLAADSIAEVVSLMQANFSDFRKTLLPGRYAILRGESIDNYTDNITEDQLLMKFRTGDWHIIPEAVGAGGIFQFVAGAVLTVVGLYTGQTWMVQMGVGLMLSGIATMLTPVPDVSSDIGSNEEPDERTSLIYAGGVNNIEQGGPIPLVYGQVMAGSILISSDVEVMELADRELGASGDVTEFEGDPA